MVAKTFPTIVAFLPIGIMLYDLVGWETSIFYKTSVSLASFVLFSFLCGEIVGGSGKRLEGKIHPDGVLPSVRYLRHRDNHITIETKKRYHTHLSARIFQQLPNEIEEGINPMAADEVYKSCVDWLVANTRDNKLLYSKLKSYGFRRTCLGLKKTCIFLNTLGLLLFGLIHISAFCELKLPTLLLLGLWVLYLLGWFFIVRKQWVLEASEAYADVLFEICDQNYMGNNSSPIT